MSGPRNTLGDLNNILFEQLERLNDDEVQGERLAEEINRAKSMSTVSNQIISTASLVLDGQKILGASLNANAKLPRMLEG